MSKHLKLAALWCLGFVFVVSAQGADDKKGLMIGGSFEGGYSYGWRSTPSLKESQFFVDDVEMKFNVNVSDKTKVILDQHFSVQPSPGTALTLSNGFNSRSYYSLARLSSGTGRTGMFETSLESAYLEHKCGENLTTSVGLIRVPFGMESQWARYDQHSYYFTTGYGLQSTYNWLADAGLKFAYTGFGNLELAVVDGRAGQSNTALNNHSPATALRWAGDFKAGDMTITPTVSNYAGRWHGSPGDLGFGLGTGIKMSSFWINTEWLYLENSPAFNDATKVKTHNVWFEPGFDMGMMNLSTKVEYVSTKVGTGTSTNDWNLAFALSHEYTEKMRIKLAYTHQNLSGNRGLHGNDIRLLFGTKW